MKKSRLRGPIYLLLLFLPAFYVGSAYAVLLDATGGAHVAYNAAPFGREGRYQQLYSSSLFSESGYIESLSFAPQAFPNATIDSTPYTADIVLKLSATTVDFSDWSGVLDDNITFSQTTVMDQIGFTTTIVNGSPNAFTFTLDFSSNPFFYAPETGNFLIDVTLSNVLFDANIVAMSRSDNDGPLARAFVNTANSDFGIVGLRTMIGFTPAPAAIPEPPLLWLITPGLLGLVGISRRKKAA